MEFISLLLSKWDQYAVILAPAWVPIAFDVINHILPTKYVSKIKKLYKFGQLWTKNKTRRQQANVLAFQAAAKQAQADIMTADHNISLVKGKYSQLRKAAERALSLFVLLDSDLDNSVKWNQEIDRQGVHNAINDKGLALKEALERVTDLSYDKFVEDSKPYAPPTAPTKDDNETVGARDDIADEQPPGVGEVDK